jgi:hypothetical protein
MSAQKAAAAALFVVDVIEKRNVSRIKADDARTNDRSILDSSFARVHIAR